MKSAILSTAEHLDSWMPQFGWRRHSEAQRLVVVLVHSLYRRESDPDSAGVFPHERMTVTKLRQLVVHFLEMGYMFVSPDDVLGNAPLPTKAMMLTVDDGYYNFLEALPVIREFHIPVTLFICLGTIARSQAFWWDAFFRNARRCGHGERGVRRQMARLRKRPHDDVYRYITERWGERAFAPTSDLDRPLSLNELKAIAREPLVHLGNHTFNHVALPFQQGDGAREEIGLARTFFERELQTSPRVISYPNGDYSDAIIALSTGLGYQLGMTIEPRWNLPDSATGRLPLMSLGRYLLSGTRDPKRQATSVNLRHSASAAIRRLSKHRYKGSGVALESP